MTHARGSGLDVIALTDHDTTGGWSAASAALPAGLTLVRGAEISCRDQAQDGAGIGLHLLAYLFDPDEPTFAAAREEMRESRQGRARRMVAGLRGDGYDVSWEQVQRLAGAGATVGRPHVARALVESGLIDSVDGAFTSDWIADDGRYYVGKVELDAVTAVRLVRGAGGVPVFAHPGASRRGRVVADEVVAAMAEAGLFGLEVDHLDHDPAARRRLRALAAELGLAVTGSSDFHGSVKSVDLGAETTDPSVYDALVAEASGLSPITG